VERASADKDAKKKKGWTPLHLASREGRKECVKLLLRAGAKMCATDYRYKTPLHHAAFGRKERVEMPLRGRRQEREE
jgi:ankyrin repeat protein